MTASKKLGIWMDHANAHLIQFKKDPIVTTIVASKFTHQEKERTLNESEKLMHNAEQHEQAEYYKELSEIIKNQDEVILFGPTDAKVELFHFLKGNPHFSKIKIEIKQADKMTENQKHAFVRDYFSKQ